MTFSDQAQLDAGCRQSLFYFLWRVFNILHPGQTFVPAWHVQAMVCAIEDAIAGRHPQLLITIPPRHLKSITTSIALPAYLLGLDPTRKVMVASYGQDLAAMMGRDTLAVMRHPDYQRMFPGTVLSDTRSTAIDFQTSMHGHRLGVTVQGTTTGFGADILILDDAMKAIDATSPELRQRARDYYEQSLYSRLNNKRDGVVIAVQQRLHEDDLAAYFIEKGFRHLNLPAIAEEDATFTVLNRQLHHRKRGDVLFPQREPMEALERTRVSMGNAAFNAQYQQNPMQPEENDLRWNDFRVYDDDWERSDFLYVVQSWDTACLMSENADWSVCITAGLDQFSIWWILDVDRARLNYSDLKIRINKLARKWEADKIVMEYASSGVSLFADFYNERGYIWEHIHMWRPKISKTERFAAQTDKVVNGLVALPKEAPWLPEFKRELLGFPHAKYDDQVDAFSQLFAWISIGTGRGDLQAVMRRLNGDGNRSLHHHYM